MRAEESTPAAAAAAQHHSEGSPSLFFPSPLTNEREAIQPNFKWTLLLYKLGLLGQFPTARQPKTPTAEPLGARLPRRPPPLAQSRRTPQPRRPGTRKPRRTLPGQGFRRRSHAEPGRGIERGSLAQGTARSVAPPQPLFPACRSPHSRHTRAPATALASTCSRTGGYQCPRTPCPGDSRLFPGHLRMVPLIFWKL